MTLFIGSYILSSSSKNQVLTGNGKTTSVTFSLVLQTQNSRQNRIIAEISIN